ncbi:HIT domain-containing protein [Candidatus Comchoanobacter bicostacola]|uniref:HIT domain-containing protein n=2 Tax=Candidatus Comchoanobacter bicostacola TaxID=2919598 RepID=A0ABY5DJG0_9GAMM|nr:HIT domain-containing protein [Candidatus Comchoanobacter bicostacola]
MMSNIFLQMISGEVKVDFVYEDEQCIVIDDVNPQAPIHMLVIPKKPIERLSEASPQDSALLGHLLTVVQKMAKNRGLDSFRVAINDGVDACQSVYQLHIHVMGGRGFAWPPG